VMGLQLAMPDSKFADGTFDAVYSSTAFEMIRGLFGEEEYVKSVKETLRVMKPGAVFGMAEPMHHKGPPPPDLEPLVTTGDMPFVKFLVTPEVTAQTFKEAGFEILDWGHVPGARDWWEEFAEFDEDCRTNPDSQDRKIVNMDAGRWLTVGYVIARKPG
ncbi:MAG: class I SAM-dependent methyltransferase, partial [Halioglobus sp.]|nr:class I SAM-dependent methyltransferase [Halioglobus sp.]